MYAAHDEDDEELFTLLLTLDTLLLEAEATLLLKDDTTLLTTEEATLELDFTLDLEELATEDDEVVA